MTARGRDGAPARRRRRRVLLGSLTAVVIAIGGTSAWLLRDPMPYFAERRSPLVSVEEGDAVRSLGHVSQPIRLTAANGLSTDLLIRFPESGSPDGELISIAPATSPPALGSNRDGLRPVFLIVGGYRTGDQAATLVEDTRGAIVAALSYPYHGPLNPKGLDVLPLVPAIRRAIFDTPPAVLLAVEYLRTRPDVDPNRIELVGASFGAPFATIAAVLDSGVSRLWLVHAAGQPFTLIDHGLKRSIAFAPARWAVAGVANVLAAGPRLTSEKWLPQVAPRPVIMINAADDERLPRAAIETLHSSAREPKDIIWLPGRHVQPNREDVIRELVQTVLARAGQP